MVNEWYFGFVLDFRDFFIINWWVWILFCIGIGSYCCFCVFYGFLGCDLGKNGVIEFC